MKKLLLALWLALAAPGAWAANAYNILDTASGGFVYTGVLSGLPAACTVGQIAFVTNATPGQNQYNCTAANTWTQNLNSGAGGASFALDNLSGVSINTALLAQTGVDVGSAVKAFRDIFLFGGGTYGSTSLRLTGTPTGNRVITFPDATGTLLYNGGPVGTPSTLNLTNATVLPLAGLVNATGASLLIGRQSGSGGAWGEVTIGANLAMSAGGVLSATGGGGSGCTPAGSAGQLLTDNGAAGCTSNTTATGVLTALAATINGAGGFVTPNGTKTFTGTTYDTAGSGNSFLINGLAATANSGTGSVVRQVSSSLAGVTLTGVITMTPTARSSGAVPYFKITTPADTGQTASTESLGVQKTAATRTWATGALALQREVAFDAPTFAFAGASALTTGVNVDIAAPVCGTNGTCTNLYALRANGNALVVGVLSAGSTPTPLTDSAGKILSSALNTLVQPTITAPIITVQALSCNTASPTWTVSAGNVMTCLLNSTNIAPAVTTSGLTGGSISIKITQAATPRTITWPAGNGTSTLKVMWPGGTAPTLSTGSGAVDTVTCSVFSEFIWHCVWAGAFS